MGRVTALLALVAGLAASAPAQAQPAPLLPLVVDEATVLPGAPGEPVTDRVSVTVRNPGTRTIVAWGVRGQVEFADGKTRPIGLSTDGAIVTLNQRGSSVLPPDGRYTITAVALPGNRPAKDVRSVTAEASFVIFDDDTALGDERSIGHHFAGRAANQRLWPIVERAFLDAMNRWTDPREVIAAADQTLSAIADEAILKSLTYLSVRRVLGTALNYPRDYSLFLKNTLEEIRVRREAADAHAQRRR